MPANIYEAAWIFFIYAFVGWCLEEIDHTITHGEFVNRGMLNGPLCPVYGLGMVGVAAWLYPLRGNFVVLFFASAILASTLEFLTGFALEKMFRTRWWDYSHLPYNIKGYVCLRYSIFWGLGCTFIIEIVHPIVYGLVSLQYNLVGYIIMAVLWGYFVVDILATANIVLKFNKHLQEIDQVAAKLHHLADVMGKEISDNVLEAQEKKKEFDQLMEQHKALLATRKMGYDRLITAFPGLKSRHADEAFKRFKENRIALREKLKESKKNKKK